LKRLRDIVVGTGIQRTLASRYAKLLWDPREDVCLKPLSRAEAGAVFDGAAQACKLSGLELDDFRNRTLASARGNPGQIVAMCRLAARPDRSDGKLRTPWAASTTWLAPSRC